MLRQKHLQLKRRKPLTCVIGATCADGCAIISDTRITRDAEASNESKIHLLWNRVALAGAGTKLLLDGLTEDLTNSISNPQPSDNIPRKIEDVMLEVQKRYEGRVRHTRQCSSGFYTTQCSRSKS